MNQKKQLKNNLTDIKNQINGINGISRDKRIQSEMITHHLNQNNIQNQQITKSSFVVNDVINNESYIKTKPLIRY